MSAMRSYFETCLNRQGSWNFTPPLIPGAWSTLEKRDSIAFLERLAQSERNAGYASLVLTFKPCGVRRRKLLCGHGGWLWQVALDANFGVGSLDILEWNASFDEVQSFCFGLDAQFLSLPNKENADKALPEVPPLIPLWLAPFYRRAFSAPDAPLVQHSPPSRNWLDLAVSNDKPQAIESVLDSLLMAIAFSTRGVHRLRATLTLDDIQQQALIAPDTISQLKKNLIRISKTRISFPVILGDTLFKVEFSYSPTKVPILEKTEAIAKLTDVLPECRVGVIRMAMELPSSSEN